MQNEKINQVKALNKLQKKLADFLTNEFKIRQTSYNDMIVFRYEDAPQQAGSVAEVLIKNNVVVLMIPSLNKQAKLTFDELDFKYDENFTSTITIVDTEESFDLAIQYLFASTIPFR